MNEEIPTDEQVRYHLDRIQRSPYVTVDTEGTLDHPYAETWGFSTCVAGEYEYFPFHHISGRNLDLHYLDMFRKVFENHPCLVFHHAKHDLRSLRALGINISRKAKWYCTMLMSHMTNENLYAQSLDAVSRHYGGQPKNMSEAMATIIKNMGWRYVPSWMMRSYGSNDGFITDEAFYKILPDFQAQGFDGELWDIEREFTWLLADMEDTGVLVDVELSEREYERGLKVMRRLEKQLGFNPASTVQLGKFLLEELKLPPVGKKGKSGRYSFNKTNMALYDELLQLNKDTRAQQILTYRGWQKTTSSNYLPYLQLLGIDGRLHANYKQHGTKTGRLSCEHPNLQQIPKTSAKDWNGNLKKAFIVAPGRVAYEFDYSQLELRLASAVGRVTQLLDVFADDSRDVFDEMSEQLGMSRDATKTLNYTVQYGGGATRISQVFGVSPPAAQAIINNYYNQYPGLRAATQRAAALCVRDGYLTYWSGRRRHFWDREKDARIAFNAYCQGGGFEIVKRRMLALAQEGLLTDECRLDLQVHDSVRLDIEEGKEKSYIPEVIRVMEDVKPDFGVRFRVNAKKWGEK